MKPVPQASRTLCVALFLIGLAALSLSLSANMMFGHSLGRSAEGKMLQSASSVTVDMTFAALCIVTGLLFRARRWMPAATIGVCAIAFGLYTLTGIVGFGAAERIAKSEEVKAQFNATSSQSRAFNQTALQFREQNLAFLKSQYVTAKKDDDKSRLLDAITKASMPPEIRTVVEVSPILADPQALTLTTLTGIEPERIQLGMVIWLAALLVTAKFLAFALASALWPKAVEAVEAVEIVETVAANDTKPVEIEPIVEKTVEKPKATVAKLDNKQCVIDWKDTATIARPGHKVTAETAYQWFVQWALGRGIPPMSQAMFGKLLADLGVEKTHNGRVVHYLGIGRALQLAA